MRPTFSTSGTSRTAGHAAFDLRYDSFMSLLRTLALLLTAGALLDGAIAADAPGSSLAAPPAQAITSRAVMTGEQVMRILDETVDWYRTWAPSSNRLLSRAISSSCTPIGKL